MRVYLFVFDRVFREIRGDTLAIELTGPEKAALLRV
jgi:hypothetical protein